MLPTLFAPLLTMATFAAAIDDTLTASLGCTQDQSQYRLKVYLFEDVGKVLEILKYMDNKS